MPFDGTQSVLGMYADILRNADESKRHRGSFQSKRNPGHYCAIGMIAESIRVEGEPFENAEFCNWNEDRKFAFISAVDRVISHMPGDLSDKVAEYNDSTDFSWSEIADMIDEYDQQES